MAFLKTRMKKLVICPLLLLELSITEADIARTHRIGNIIVKFVRYSDRKDVFNRKKKLKGKNIAITEFLKTYLKET